MASITVRPDVDLMLEQDFRWPSLYCIRLPSGEIAKERIDIARPEVGVRKITGDYASMYDLAESVIDGVAKYDADGLISMGRQ